MFVAWVGLNVSLFGSSDRTDKYFQDLINTHLGSIVYPYEAHDDITVLLLTDQTLNSEELQGRWPTSYDFHANVLKTLLRYKPKALFIDFLWLSHRTYSPETGRLDGEDLIDVLQKYQAEGISVYVPYTEVVARNWPQFEGLVTWVSVPLGFNVSDFIARVYPIEQNGIPTAAFKIKSDLTRESPQQISDRPMDIVWGTRQNHKNEIWMADASRSVQASLADSIWATLSQGYDHVAYRVPYSTTLFVRDLLTQVALTPEEAYEQTKEYVNDKIILYGANLEGVNDMIFTPARNVLPGVYYHAMALDNLLQLGDSYKSEDGPGSNATLNLHGLLSFLTVFPVAVFCAFGYAVSKGQIPAKRYPLKRVRAFVEWSGKYPYWRLTLITILLLFWFGFAAWVEFAYFNYSASVVMGYVQVIVLGFFMEKTMLIDRTIDRIQALFFWLKNR
jgi:hypothetical protein|tara:strand:- start:1899 stop:3236 length:1338 start_codon:yes stop_codon:yes gene_type:complete